MKFLVDAQLPARLAQFLSELGHESVHVWEVGLRGATDEEIWKHAAAIGAALIRKDEDFVIMRALASLGSAVVWVRIGNCTNKILLGRFSQVLGRLTSALERGESVIEVSASD